MVLEHTAFMLTAPMLSLMVHRVSSSAHPFLDNCVKNFSQFVMSFGYVKS